MVQGWWGVVEHDSAAGSSSGPLQQEDKHGEGLVADLRLWQNRCLGRTPALGGGVGVTMTRPDSHCCAAAAAAGVRGNHVNIFGIPGHQVRRYRYFDAKTRGLDYQVRSLRGPCQAVAWVSLLCVFVCCVTLGQ